MLQGSWRGMGGEGTAAAYGLQGEYIVRVAKSSQRRASRGLLSVGNVGEVAFGPVCWDTSGGM